MPVICENEWLCWLIAAPGRLIGESVVRIRSDRIPVESIAFAVFISIFRDSLNVNFESNTETEFEPLVHSFEISSENIPALFERFASKKHCIFLDSSLSVTSPQQTKLGRYSFIASDPIEWMQLQKDCHNPFDNLRRMSSQFRQTASEQLPPFQGGWAGLFCYDLNRSLERIPQPKFDEFQLPLIAAGLYDVVLAIDNEQDRAHLISQGWPETKLSDRERLAERRLREFRGLIESNPLAPLPRADGKRVNLQAPYFPIAGPPGLLSNFDEAGYLAAVQKCIDYIHAGDAFQINLAQQLLLPASRPSIELYQRLRRINPAPFSGYFDLGPSQIISASPERFLQVMYSKVETRPIKGTRRRTRFPEVDLTIAEELRNSEKDRAENTMIVDLMRNDLSRVCRDESIHVTQFCELEKYQSVLHLVSAVQGELKKGVDVFDLLQNTFPGGSITGAPKIRAMEIIQELEPTARGAYCGSLGYIGLNGDCDLNILIRTITAKNGWWQIPVGGGIVSQSIPEKEYAETWTKAAAMLKAMNL